MQGKIKSPTGRQDPREVVTSQQMNFLQYVMGGIVIVLFLGFVATLLAVLAILIQWWQFNANTQSELTKAIYQLSNQINSLHVSSSSGQLK